MATKRISSFRDQRVFWTFAIFLIVFAFTTGVLWSHLDNVLNPGTYRLMARAGLFLLPAVALLMTIWELFVDDVHAPRRHESHPSVKRLVNWCFYASIGLALCEVAHAGGILTFESSTAQQKAKLETIGEAQAKIAGAAAGAAIEAAGRQAQEMNARGQRRTAGKAINAGQDVAAQVAQSAQKATVDSAEKMNAVSFLPDWYLQGGMYVALPFLALVCFGITMFFARQAQLHVDKDDDGIPDAEEFPRELDVQMGKDLRR